MLFPSWFITNGYFTIPTNFTINSDVEVIITIDISEYYDPEYSETKSECSSTKMRLRMTLLPMVTSPAIHGPALIPISSPYFMKFLDTDIIRSPAC